jgi:pyruvate/2-oxoglutarate dehydrogenase complex dihydrolipoamide acyltransferase (E2) component
MRRIVYWVINRVPQVFRSYSSPVLVTAVGMFGNGSGWGIPKSSQTLTVTLGGIAAKPEVFEEEIRIREILNLTLSVNHDIVDGAPAARFANELTKLIEVGHGLRALNLEA